MVEADGVEYQVKTSFPLRVRTQNAFNRRSVVRDHLIRATLRTNSSFLLLHTPTTNAAPIPRLAI